jgi:uncharacterized protein
LIVGKIIINSSSDTSLCHIGKAETFFERGQGLLGCKGLAEGHGMLISPCNSIHTFFMKFAIDVIFLSKEDQILTIKHNMKPQRFSRSGNASSVLEVMAGQAHLSGLRNGDTLVWGPLK